MKKNLSIFFLISVIVILIFFISAGKKTIAEECNDCPTPTEPGDSDYCGMDHPFNLSSNNDEIECGTPVMITVNDGIGPFTGSVDGNGYSLVTISDNKFSLSCSQGCACGDSIGQAGAVASVTVKDECGKTETVKIRNTSGQWGSLQDICSIAGGEDIQYGDPVGDRRYRVSRGHFSYFAYEACSNSCPSLLLSDIGSNGFPNSDGITFECFNSSKHGEILVKKPASSTYPNGSPFPRDFIAYKYQEWICK